MGRNKGIGGTDIEAGGAAAAVFFDFRRVGLKGNVSVNLTQEKPGTGAFVDQHRILCDPAQAGPLGNRPFQDRGAVDKGAVLSCP